MILIKLLPLVQITFIGRGSISVYPVVAKFASTRKYW
jgi:hypothetical protein